MSAGSFHMRNGRDSDLLQFLNNFTATPLILLADFGGSTLQASLMFNLENFMAVRCMLQFDII